MLRIRPSYFHHPCVPDLTSLDSSQSISAQLETFFAQPWVQNGDPEIAFIKRAAREGDRWTSHVALPGGKRDPGDADDKATAIRETSEEIGLDLNSDDALYVGNLPERVVSTSWGKVPLMVLCPFLFIYTKPDIPQLRLQPTEVASTHWVPLRVLLSPSVRTYEYVDVTDRFARQGSVFLKTLIRSVLGKMRFSAVRLLPSESLYCSTTAEFFSPPEAASQPQGFQSLAKRVYKWYLGDHAGSADRSRPLLLWGLTLGIMADFLDQLPPYNAVKLWSYPTFTALDTRFIIDLLSRGLKERNKVKLQGNQTAVDSETVATTVSGDNPWFIGGLSQGMKCDKGNGNREYAVGIMLEGYYDVARRGVWLSAATRLLGTLAFVFYIVRRFRRQ